MKPQRLKATTFAEKIALLDAMSPKIQLTFAPLDMRILMANQTLMRRQCSTPSDSTRCESRCESEDIDLDELEAQCPYCGTVHLPGAIFCCQCGRKRLEARNEVKEPSEDDQDPVELPPASSGEVQSDSIPKAKRKPGSENAADGESASEPLVLGSLKTEFFVGTWKDSKGHPVHVGLVRDDKGVEQLTASLSKSSAGRDLQLSIWQSLDGSSWHCGEGKLDIQDSRVGKLVWRFWDGKVLTWSKKDPVSSQRQRNTSSELDDLLDELLQLPKVSEPYRTEEELQRLQVELMAKLPPLIYPMYPVYTHGQDDRQKPWSRVHFSQ
eukprot:TRINITY_DN96549_c0_g1_i1.p1 TRINITY_DN96549_c0_g1~~TRINITY_DN96549_c0_g1_i1.p1  ORF type:complete len:324 (-),score=74.78 TRINITY_DN96549_c0_g1_i1:82-1053(-)